MAAYLDIIILLVVVVLVFSKLKSLLGTRPDNFEQRKISDENAAKIFDMIVKEAEKNAAAEARNMEKEEVQVPEEELSEIDKVLAKIPGFNREKFLTGAERAFEIIISAFSKGDVETLEMLVSKSLLKKFQEIIEKRKAEGITSETDFIGFDDVEITNAKISKSEVAKIRSGLSANRSIFLRTRTEKLSKATRTLFRTLPTAGLSSVLLPLPIPTGF